MFEKIVLIVFTLVCHLVLSPSYSEMIWISPSLSSSLRGVSVINLGKCGESKCALQEAAAQFDLFSHLLNYSPFSLYLQRVCRTLSRWFRSTLHSLKAPVTRQKEEDGGREQLQRWGFDCVTWNLWAESWPWIYDWPDHWGSCSYLKSCWAV